jgi:NADP-dependent 3-hydroxy acid dehydrogenase YdfG
VRLAGSAIIITGASGGIGSATARELVRRGARVVLAARHPDPLHALASELGVQNALACPTDVRDRSQIDRLVDATQRTFGRIDAVINAAGVSKGARVTSDPDAEMQEIVETNLLAIARTTQAALPALRQARGVIVNIGSVAGEIGTLGLYSGTKFGVRGLSDSLRRELRSEHVAVVLIEPGFVRTPMTRDVKVPMPGPEVVATAIARALVRPRAKVIVPWPYIPLVYLSKAPGLTDLAMGRLRGGNRRRSGQPSRSP